MFGIWIADLNARAVDALSRWRKPGRESPEANLFWSSGSSIDGIAPGAAVIEKTETMELPQRHRSR